MQFAQFTDSNWCGDTDDLKFTVGYIYMFLRNTTLMMFEEGIGICILGLLDRVHFRFIVCVSSRVVNESIEGARKQ